MNKSTAEIAKLLGEKGISESNEIVLYDNGTSKYSGRLYWVLKYMGAKDVKILNGELEAWKAGRKPITKAPATRTAVTFTANVQPQYLAKMDDIVKATAGGNYVIIDARTAEEFAGTDEDLRQTRVTQPAIFLHSVILSKVMGERFFSVYQDTKSFFQGGKP